MVAAGPELPKPVNGWAGAIVVIIPFLILRAAECFFHPFHALRAVGFPDRHGLEMTGFRLKSMAANALCDILTAS
jgi:hypothetical protein